jgi:hypothetical protein
MNIGVDKLTRIYILTLGASQTLALALDGCVSRENWKRTW